MNRFVRLIEFRKIDQYPIAKIREEFLVLFLDKENTR